MHGFTIPIHISGRFSEDNQAKNVRKSIDDFIHLLVASSNNSFKADRNFGFAFKNFRFENSDENEHINLRKIHGNSNNKNNYAFDLKKSIEQYESRLTNIQVNMEYNHNKKEVSLLIAGKYKEEFVDKIYELNIKFHIW